MKFYFNDQAFSFELLRAATYAGYQGAEIGECLVTASKITEGDFESWFSEWKKMADQTVKIAEDCLVKRHKVSAREAFLRAHNYYRTGEFFLDGTDPRRMENFENSVNTFEKSMELIDTHFEIVKIPYENTYLKGYFYGAAVDKKDELKVRPTLIFIGGYDSTLQELYFSGAAPAIKRGYHCLVFEMPGQGEALRKQNLYMRHDAEVPVGAAIDYLETRTDIAMDKIALLGMSLGGYFAPRAAAFDERIKACIAFNVFYDTFDSTLNQNPQLSKLLQLPEEQRENMLAIAEKDNSNLRWMLNNGRWVFGLDHRYELFEEMKKASLKGIAGKIKCPILLTMGETDHFVSQDQLTALIDEIKAPKTIRVFTKDEGAEEHCQEGNHALFHQVMFDWLDELFDNYLD
ncbi:bile acid acyltransferase/acyl-CoA thioester hydrolase-like protein [Lachnotalea glycerini]|uniref:Alpha/beta fold hydrolase n=1 Tax=Lachnotalea glycerini TaxID=1763509 RepID=A0A255IQ08_9FIRM|nr:alpha/beta hydrolase [Lachnotalea glycerini]PXV87849.1 bile acid acyltransferase/acyl-CoA thioester hydrolase-like protein [Lachnotalea glycerini]RDY30250.1 alpha/beta fold hydrolase [Lachnotalea glycerini]